MSAMVRRRGLALTLIVAVATGCATAPPAREAAPPARHTYAEARAEADALWAEYSRRARHETTATNVLYAWLAAIGATIVGLGVTGTSGVPITALGLGGAYSYGLGTWLIKPEHLAVYKAGADAMRCIRDRSRPLGSAEAYARALGPAVADGGALDRRLGDVTTAMATVQEIAVSGADAATKEEALDAAREAESGARTVQRQARTLVRDLEDAGDQLWTAVETVRTEVEYGIRRHTDPRDILAHIQQNVLGTYKDLLALGGGAANKAAAGGLRLQSRDLSATLQTQLAQRVDALKAAVIALVAETKRVAGLMEASSIPGVAEGIADCLTAAQTGVSVPRIYVRPVLVSLTPGASETVMVIGTARATLQKLPSSAPFTWSTTVSEGTTAVSVKADDVAQAGEYVLLVTAPLPNDDTVERTVKIVITGAGARTAAITTPDVNTLLADRAWTCGPAARWTVGPAAGGGTRASIVCDSSQSADAMIRDAAHVAQLARLKSRHPRASVTADQGKVQIIVPEAVDRDAFVAALRDALQ